MLRNIIVTGGSGRFAQELKKIRCKYNFIFRSKNQLNFSEIELDKATPKATTTFLIPASYKASMSPILSTKINFLDWPCKMHDIPFNRSQLREYYTLFIKFIGFFLGAILLIAFTIFSMTEKFSSDANSAKLIAKDLEKNTMFLKENGFIKDNQITLKGIYSTEINECNASSFLFVCPWPPRPSSPTS